MPRIMTIALVEGDVYWKNQFPSKAGISNTLSPVTIVLGTSKPNVMQPLLPFVSYIMVYTTTTIDTKTRSVPVLFYVFIVWLLYPWIKMQKQSNE